LTDSARLIANGTAESRHCESVHLMGNCWGEIPINGNRIQCGITVENPSCVTPGTHRPPVALALVAVALTEKWRNQAKSTWLERKRCPGPLAIPEWTPHARASRLGENEKQKRCNFKVKLETDDLEEAHGIHLPSRFADTEKCESGCHVASLSLGEKENNCFQ